MKMVVSNSQSEIRLNKRSSGEKTNVETISGPPQFISNLSTENLNSIQSKPTHENIFNKTDLECEYKEAFS